MSEQRNGNLTTADLAYGKRNSNEAESQSLEDKRPISNASTQIDSLMPEQERGSYMEKWTAIQGTFVDEPKQSVEQADTLVAEVIQQLAQKFAEQRKNLEQQWSNNGDASTEDLRLAMQQYRSFFQRLLAA